jgi:hypothetical protein
MICETVLRCNPDTLARSALEIGWRARINCRTISRLIWRAVSLEADSIAFGSTRPIPFVACQEFFKTSPESLILSGSPESPHPPSHHNYRSTHAKSCLSTEIKKTFSPRPAKSVWASTGLA